jgi:hypothetical protein
MELLTTPEFEYGKKSPLAFDHPVYQKRYSAIMDNLSLWGWDPNTKAPVKDAPKGIVRYEGDEAGYARRRMIEMLLANAEMEMNVMDATTFTTTGLDIAKIRDRFFPVLTRALAGLITNQIASIQPIPMPTGLVFYLQWLYETGASAGNRPDIPSQYSEEYSHNNVEAGNVAEDKFEIGSISVTAETWKRVASWSVEAAQDLWNVHGIATADIVPRFLANIISVEIDRLFIRFIRNNAKYTVIWDAGDSTGLTPWASKTDENRKAYRQTFRTEAIASLEAQMLARKNVEPNWMVFHPNSLPHFKRLEGYNKQFNPMDLVRPLTSLGRAAQVVGKLDDQYILIADPLYPNQNEILVGYKGESFMDTGAVLAMYVPPLPTVQFTHPQNNRTYQGCMARDAFVMVPEGGYYYGLISITNNPQS